MTRTALEFVDLTLVNGPQAREIRRQIRSHAAKVGGGGDASDKRAQQKPPRKQRRRQNLTWTVQVRQPDKEDARREDYGPSSSSSPLSPASLSALTTIPASKSPVYHQPFVPAVLQNYLDHLAVAIPEIDGEGNSALLKTRWFPMVIHSPVVFQVIVLFSASHYAAQREDLAFAPIILFLKQCALSGISQYLSRSNGTVRDELIAATAKMASYEAIWGEEHAYHCHMGAVEEMIRMRGGLGSLGLDGFLARLLIFIDTNSAFLLNTSLHLPESSFPRVEPFILPNLSRFIGEI